MDDESLHSRLSQIATRWTLIKQAHGVDQDDPQQAQSLLLERYQRPIYRYLVASLGSADAADELFQEFALRFVQGGFRQLSPERGKFRAYVKTVLARMIGAHRKKAYQRRAGSGSDDLPTPAGADEEASLFDESWRREVLDRTWEALQEHQSNTGNAYFSVLRHRAENPKASSAEMAAELTRRLAPKSPYTDAGIRQILKRAREKFADLLINEIAESISSQETDRIEQELVALQLLPYCRSALKRRRGSE